MVIGERETVNAAVEREVQRRMVEQLASAGVPHGRLSLEVIYMLPPDFLTRYVSLFYLALREDSGTSSARGSSDPVRKVDNKGGNLRDKDQSKGQRPKARIGVYGRGGGKRHRTYWTVRNEQALRLKGSVDRKLLRLARELQRDLDSLDGGVTASKRVSAKAQADSTGPTCEACSAPLLHLKEALGASLRYCPHCGTGIKLKPQSQQ